MPEKINSKALSWLPVDQIEESALEQIRNLSGLPFIWKHIAVMPDCHYGMGATIGSVIPTDGTVVPAAVGVDLHCGMIAVRTSLRRTALETINLGDIREAIEAAIPAGKGGYNEAMTGGVQKRVNRLEYFIEKQRAGRVTTAPATLERFNRLDRNWRLQMGSLGSGNHFIEICADQTGDVWTFLHSGSRGIGNRLAQLYIKTAKRLMKTWHISLPDPDLAYLPPGTPENREYLYDLAWAGEFANENREEMTERVLTVLRDYFPDIRRRQTVHKPHNYAAWENHFGRNVLVTRKGAISGRKGQWGVIPGAMGTQSYIVRGKGNKAAFDSGPHGAGRQMSRRKARQAFSMDDFDRELAAVEVKRSERFLDELPGAYKDVGTVMAQSRDLVDIAYRLEPVINIKGD